MPTFDQLEVSRYSGSPYYLYRFDGGPGLQWAYTSSETPEVLDGVTYQPIPIAHESIVATGGEDKTALRVRTSSLCEVADEFLVWPPSSIIEVSIYLAHVGAADRKVAWVGRLSGVTWEGDAVTLTVEPSAASLRNPGLRRHYQLGCPHVLYGPHCKATKVPATVQPLGFLTGRWVLLPTGWHGARTAASFAGGFAEWTAGRAELRQILRAQADRILLGGSLFGLTTASVMSLLPGCARTMESCRVVHNNIANFGGMPFIPVKNPFGFDSNFY
jgi:uncharacterized phage protein (TIGR02218 family)